MEESCTGKDFYTQHFNPRDHLAKYYKISLVDDGLGQFVTFFLKGAHRAFTLDGIKGDTLIDIGSGASICQFLSACESFREIIATDYADQNREEMQRWLKKELGAFDWTPIVKYVCELEGDRGRESPKSRQAVPEMRCDPTQPFGPAGSSSCRLLALQFVLRCGLQGHPHLPISFQEHHALYMVGQHKFSVLFLEKEVIEEAVRQAGFVIKWTEETRIEYLFGKGGGQRETYRPLRKGGRSTGDSPR
uniref:Nicotinamide N-methyltransferase n=1 Tax=Laticauda laticaudata TaxID=8630 RepID=A0A8C5SGI4_LATLA